MPAIAVGECVFLSVNDYVRGGHRRRCGSNDYTSRLSPSGRVCQCRTRASARARTPARSHVYGRAADGGDLLLLFIFLILFLFFQSVFDNSLCSTQTIARQVLGARVRTRDHEKGNE